MKNKKGFSLVELLVVLAITSVLIGLSAYGISIAQRNNRNSQRVDIIAQMKLGIEKYYQENGTLPATSDFQYSNDMWKVCLDGLACAQSHDIKADAAFLAPGTASTSTATLYVYRVENNGTYTLGVQNEGGTNWHELGSNNTTKAADLAEDTTTYIGISSSSLPGPTPTATKTDPKITPTPIATINPKETPPPTKGEDTK